MNLKLILSSTATLLSVFSSFSNLATAAKVTEWQPWNFITLADWHGAEKFALKPIFEGEEYSEKIVEEIEMIKYVEEKFGGDLILMPGDSQGGKWDEKQFIDRLDPTLTPEASVEKAGANTWDSMQLLFRLGGYVKLLIAVGDHEIGGNSWPEGSLHLRLMPIFREAFTRSFYRQPDGKLTYISKVGKAKGRPYNTVFESTSYATIHKNALYVTVDVFHNVDGSDFYDVEKGIGGEGAVTCTLEGKHYEWFISVLESGAELKKKGTIKHIFVQAHDPVDQPVRRINSSGQFFDYGVKSTFWKAMAEYGVDIYFAGEVHDTTVSLDSGVVQLVSRGNSISNFLNVEVLSDKLVVTSYNEVGDKPKYNANFEENGKLVIDKSSGSKQITSNGVLKVLDKSKPMLRFTFDSIVPLNTRQVIGLKHEQLGEKLIGDSMNVQGKICTDSMPNAGEFGQNYDAQVNMDLVDFGGVISAANGKNYITGGKVGEFKWNTQAAVWGMGPHSGGIPISYSVWIKTETCKNQIIMSYASVYAHNQDTSRTNQFTLITWNGRPAIMFGEKEILIGKGSPQLCTTDKWNHIAVTMPRSSSLFTDVLIYVNGEPVDTGLVDGHKDKNIFINTRGRVSLGTWGHAGRIFPTWPYKNFIGYMEEARVYTRSLSQDDVFDSMGPEYNGKVTKPPKKLFQKYFNATCKRNGMTIIKSINRRTAWSCSTECKRTPECMGYEVRKLKNQKVKCSFFTTRPKLKFRNFADNLCVKVI